eukprot:NODE_5720_length_559_cov_365.158730.p2 GENE.NODE_5720_length_559_cov_365.158730~~NODE_5720_length_559_cov_365.158730.p2  ORF type:complete len:87 (+),score=22.93 NODE_5720_length_559_cov_365.158730:3-263(+)
MGEQPWPAVPFANREVKDALSKKYGVRGIPTMVRLDGANGELADTNCRARIQIAQDGEALLAKWSGVPTVKVQGTSQNKGACCAVM